MVKDYQKILEIANDTRKFEIGVFWKRAGFFWLFIVSAFVGYSYFFNKDHQKALLVANFGFITSLFWVLANRGSKFWQVNWEKHIDAIESKALGYPLFSKVYPSKEKGFFSAKRFSPSKLVIALSYYMFLAWVVILLIQIVLVVIHVSKISIIGFVAFFVTGFTICYVGWVYFESKKHYN